MKMRLSIVAAIASLGITGTGLGQTVADFFPEQKIIASDGEAHDRFGTSVAISGTSALVGAYWDDDNGDKSGSAYIFEQQEDGSWLETAKLLASDGASSDYFGFAVAISGTTALVGAVFDNDNGESSGSAYIFEQQEDGTWLETAKLTASDGAILDYFGISVAISGTSALVGARLDDDNGSDSGSAYIFEQQQDGSWLETAKLTASDGAGTDYFGSSVAISGTTALVGAFFDDDNGSSSGSAYIFEQQPDGSWLETAKLTASDGASLDNFGGSVAISGTTALVGAYNDDDDNGNDSGSAYIFKQQQDGTWLETTKLTASDGASFDYFGRSVAISGTTALVGAYYDNDNGENSGSAYIFEQQEDGSWLEAAKLTASDGAGSDYFGRSVVISGTTALVGAYYDDDNGIDSGSSFFYEINSVINLDFNNTGYPSLESALSQTYANEHLAVRSEAFNIGGILDLSGKPLNFIAVEPVNIGNQLMFLPGDGSSFIDSDDVAEAGYSLAGSLIAPDSGQLVFSNLELDTGGELVQNNSSLFVYGNMNNHAGTGYLAGNIFADQGDVSTDAGGVNRISRDTDIYADYVNDGTTAVHRGTLYIYGDLSGEGTMLGDVDTGPGLRGGDLPSPGDGFSIGGSSILGVDASLRMLDFDWTLGIGGDVDWAINANDRFAMNGATLELTGLNTGLQSLELMSLDVGPNDTGFDSAPSGHFPLGTLRVAAGTTVNLVDSHDNALDGTATCEAIYASTLVVEPGGVLVTNGCPVYVQVLDNQGSIDGDVTEIPEVPDCLGDLDGNGSVDIEDLLSTLNDWGCETDCTADVNDDGSVDISDLLTIIANWGDCGS